jgi:hypothetical protein
VEEHALSSLHHVGALVALASKSPTYTIMQLPCSRESRGHYNCWRYFLLTLIGILNRYFLNRTSRSHPVSFASPEGSAPLATAGGHSSWKCG